MLGEGGFGQVWKFEADNIDGAKGSWTLFVASFVNCITFGNFFLQIRIIDLYLYMFHRLHYRGGENVESECC